MAAREIMLQVRGSSALLLAALTLGALLGSRLSRSPAGVVFGALAGCSLAAAVTLTAFRPGYPLRTPVRCAVTVPVLLTGDGVVNLLLLAPAAFFAVLAAGRPRLVVAVLTCTSLSVEAIQALRSVGVCDSSDMLLNTAGAAMGALAGLLAHRVTGSIACRTSC